MKKVLRIAILFILIISFENCATIFSGSKTMISINTIPEGAKVQINGIEKGITPVKVILKKKIFKNNVTVTKEGYQSKNFKLKREFNFISVLNLFNWIGWGIDYLTGSVMSFNPKHYEEKLELLKK